MNTLLLVAAVSAGLPGCTLQDPAAPSSPDTAVFAATCGVEDKSQDKLQDNSGRASSALPARASTRPAPQLGTVAPATRVPSQVVTPSMRAMERATAAQAGQTAHVDKNAQMPCPAAPMPAASEQGGAKAPGS